MFYNHKWYYDHNLESKENFGPGKEPKKDLHLAFLKKSSCWNLFKLPLLHAKMHTNILEKSKSKSDKYVQGKNAICSEGTKIIFNHNLHSKKNPENKHFRHWRDKGQGTRTHSDIIKKRLSLNGDLFWYTLFFQSSKSSHIFLLDPSVINYPNFSDEL